MHGVLEIPIKGLVISFPDHFQTSTMSCKIITLLILTGLLYAAKKFPTEDIAICGKLMIQFSALFPRGETLGRGAMVAQRTLDPFILVRIRTPQPGKL
jgi:hypothetical protein